MRQVVAAAMLLLAATRAEARKTRKAPPQALTPDQQLVVAAAVDDTFPRPRAAAALALCLDVQILAATDEAGDDDVPTPTPRAKKHDRGRATRTEPKPPRLRGAPPELVEQLTRPWRAVASAVACSTDPRKPLTLGDAQKTPARLVTVHVAATAAAGTLKIDWTSGQPDDPDATSSRDCTAANKGNGWTVRCGGTWFQ
ncbi:MAG TPA: hypothetical protein VH560_00120 [Polyangia bacterium]|nr:hypothetical protein [Polyangia bacterium]